MALCVFAMPSEDETIGTFDIAEDNFDPRDPSQLLKKILLLKKKKKIIFG